MLFEKLLNLYIDPNMAFFVILGTLKNEMNRALGHLCAHIG